MSFGRSMVEVKSLVVTESAPLKPSSGQQMQQAEPWMGETVPADAADEFEGVVLSSGGPRVEA